MKKVISFSLWGNNPIYTIGAVKNVELAHVIYPDWICRFYIGLSTDNEIVEQISDLDRTEVILMKDICNEQNMLWRFYPASDKDVDVMISRDADSRLSTREKEAVDEWLSSDKDFHIMRDHPHHRLLVMGGMWGIRNGLVPNFKNLIDEYYCVYNHIDQIFLQNIIYPLVKNHALVHDEFFEKKPFPSPRVDNRFIGEQFDEDDNLLHPEYSLR